MGVYLYTDEWLPWEHTIAYYPLNWDINDHSSNGYNLSWSITYQTVGNIQVAKFSWSNYLTAWQQVVTETKTLTISFWIELNTSSSEQAIVCNAQSPSYKDNWINITKFPNTYNIWSLYGHNATWWMEYWPTTLSSWTWVHYVSIFDRTSGTIKVYKDWTLVGSASAWYDLTYTWVALTIGWSATWNRYFDGRLSNVIIENKTWTAEQVAWYYNQTKSNYWL